MRPTSRALIDVLFIFLFGLILVVVLLRDNPPTKETDEPPPGQLAIEIGWPKEQDADVDLWAKAPGERPVGYSNMAEPTLNLLRDDLGHIGDWFGANYENIYSRGLKDGEYIINVHLYRNRALTLPIKVKVRAWIQDQYGRQEIFAEEVELHFEGHEITAASFTLKDGKLVAGSVHHTQILLRTARMYGQ